MKAAPCKNCLERKSACSGTCEKYKKWRREIEDEKADKNKRHMIDDVLYRGLKRRRGR